MCIKIDKQIKGFFYNTRQQIIKKKMFSFDNQYEEKNYEICQTTVGGGGIVNLIFQ